VLTRRAQGDPGNHPGKSESRIRRQPSFALMFCCLCRVAVDIEQPARDSLCGLVFAVMFHLVGPGIRCRLLIGTDGWLVIGICTDWGGLIAVLDLQAAARSCPGNPLEVWRLPLTGFL